jgi:anti-sigma B factor antagonist
MVNDPPAHTPLLPDPEGMAMRDQELVPQLSIDVQNDGGAPVVMLSGELDLGTIGALTDTLDRLDGSPIVDLEGLSFIDSSGIRTLVIARKRMLKNGGDLVLLSPQPQVRRVLEITGLDDLIR